MRFPRAALLALASLSLAARAGGAPDKPVWPLTLREGLPASLPGFAAAPSDPLPEDSENEMGAHVEVSRFFQRIESKSSTSQFRIAIQDYAAARDLTPDLRKAFQQAKQTGAVETREVEFAGRKAFLVTDRSSGRPTTLVTVVAAPSRLVLGEGANVGPDEAIRLVSLVDMARVVAIKK
ncbi:MAG TPA: hypothetical protein VKG01_08830 [Thermoanaerobaculia bacterium]|nr:hypothetical protein [Thermoanaerobaculia bacterium]